MHDANTHETRCLIFLFSFLFCTEIIDREEAIAEASGGDAVDKVLAVRVEVGAGECEKPVVVTGVGNRVSEEEERGNVIGTETSAIIIIILADNAECRILRSFLRARAATPYQEG